MRFEGTDARSHSSRPSSAEMMKVASHKATMVWRSARLAQVILADDFLADGLPNEFHGTRQCAFNRTGMNPHCCHFPSFWPCPLRRSLIGERIRDARLKSRPPLSQQDLAGRLAARGISIDQTGVSRIERQERYLMDYEIKAIARCLRVTVAWLFNERR